MKTFSQFIIDQLLDVHLCVWEVRGMNPCANTVEPRFNEPLFNQVLDITNDILCPGQRYSKMYGIEPRYNEPQNNEFFDITDVIRKPKRKMYLGITNYVKSLLWKSRFFVNKSWASAQNWKQLLVKATMLNELHLKTRHFWVTKIALNYVTEVTCVTNQSLTMTSI